MKKFKFLIIGLYIISLIYLNSCGEAKKGFRGKKIDQGNEFLIIKKNPLVKPPDFNDLPLPQDIKNSEKNTNQENDFSKDNQFKKILEEKGVVNSEDSKEKKASGSLEENVLKKIKK